MAALAQLGIRGAVRVIFSWELWPSLFLGACAGEFTGEAQLRATIPTWGSVEAPAALTILGLTLAGLTLMAGFMNGEYIIFLAGDPELSIPRDLFRFRLDAAVAGLAALAGGALILWSYEAFPQLVTRSLFGIAVFLGAWTVILTFNLVQIVAERARFYGIVQEDYFYAKAAGKEREFLRDKIDLITRVRQAKASGP